MGGNKIDDLRSNSAKLTSPFLQTRYYIYDTENKLSILVPGLLNRQNYPEKLDILLSLNASGSKKKCKFISLFITYFIALQLQDLRFLQSQSVLLRSNISASEVW